VNDSKPTTRPTTSIPREEYEQRRERAREGAAARGLDALLVCSRGGGTVDRYGDVFYLASFYTPFPYIPDRAPGWSGRGHAFLWLPVRGEARLVVDVPYLSGVALPEAQVVKADDLLGAVVEGMREAGLERGRVGLVGEDVLSWRAARTLAERLPGVEWLPADDVVAGLRARKSAAEIALLREASRVGSRAIEAMLDSAAPGVTHGDLVAACQSVLAPAGGILYNSFMASGRGGERPRVVRHSFPTWGAAEPLAEGDWLRLGISGVVGGYYFDLSRSRAIGRPSNAQVEAFEAAIEVVRAGIEAIRPGRPAGEVARAGLARQAALGFPVDSVFSGLGHGIGVGWDEPWLVPEETTPLEPGMVLNVERTLQRDGHLGDFEETVLLTEHGPELLTDARVRSW